MLPLSLLVFVFRIRTSGANQFWQQHIDELLFFVLSARSRPRTRPVHGHTQHCHLHMVVRLLVPICIQVGWSIERIGWRSVGSERGV